MFHVVLHNPVIPPNTGNVLRTAAVAGATLHLVEPLGFSLDDAHLRRAGLDYHDLAHVLLHRDVDALLRVVRGEASDADVRAALLAPARTSGGVADRGAGGDKPSGNDVGGGMGHRGAERDPLGTPPSGRVFAFTGRADRSLASTEFSPGDTLLFGTEPTGLPDEVLDDPRVTARVRIPMIPGARSLNLSNAAAIVLYEAWRQQGYRGGA